MRILDNSVSHLPRAGDAGAHPGSPRAPSPASPTLTGAAGQQRPRESPSENFPVQFNGLHLKNG